MAKIYKSVEKLKVEESNTNIFNSPTYIYLTLNKGHLSYLVLDLGGLEMPIILTDKVHGVDLYQLIQLLCI